MLNGLAGKAIYLVSYRFLYPGHFTKPKQMKVTELPKINVGKEKAGSITLLYFRSITHKPTVIKTLYVDTNNGAQREPKINLHSYNQSIRKVLKEYSLEKWILIDKWC